MKFLLTYDVNVGHDEVKDLLMKHGYMDRLECDDKMYRQLPNTTLLVERENVSEIEKNFLAACEIYNRESENKILKSKTRYFIVQWYIPAIVEGPIVKK